MGSTTPGRVRVERGIYRQPNGKYAVCRRHAGRLRFRTVAFDLGEARRERLALIAATREGKVPVSPRLRFETVAGWWLERFEAKVAAGERHPRTLATLESVMRFARRCGWIVADPAERLELEAGDLRPGMMVADVIPNPARTRLIRDAEARGATTLDGTGMLVQQGVASIGHWTGVDVDPAVMRRALAAIFL